MFKIIGGDGREYGPATAEDIRQWIRQGRADGRTRVCAEGSLEWRTLDSIEEFASDISAVTAARAAIAPSLPYAGRGGNNGMAMAGFILSILGLPCFVLPVFSFLGILLSSIGLWQLRRNKGQEGRSLAVTGIIIGGVTLLVWLVAAIVMGVMASNGAFDGADSAAE
jgi:hypothetical protein